MNCSFDGLSLQNKRKLNMDSLLIKSRLIQGQQVLLCVVCDGVGSLSHGAIASRLAVQRLQEWFSKVDEVDQVGLKFRDAILQTNEHIIVQSAEQALQTASTLSALLLTEDTYYTAHIGDSRIYQYCQNQLVLLTKDDISDSGKLRAWIGQDKSILLQYSEGPLQDAVFILCSDGLYKRMDSTFLLQQLALLETQSIHLILKKLTHFVIEQGENDNISIALVLTKS